MSHKKVERIDPLTQALPCVGCDSHAHLDGEEFDADREEVLARARAAGVATIGNIFLDPDRWRRRRGYFDAHPEVFFVLGIHPCDGQQCTPEVLADIREAFAVDDRLRAVGEIGLDFYWDDCPKEIQYQVLHDQRVHPRVGEMPCQFGGARNFRVGQYSVDCGVNFRPVNVRERAQPGYVGYGICRRAARAEAVRAYVHGVRSGENRLPPDFRVPRGA